MANLNFTCEFCNSKLIYRNSYEFKLDQFKGYCSNCVTEDLSKINVSDFDESGIWKCQETKRWFRVCPSCENDVSYARRNYCHGADLIGQPCNACTPKTNRGLGLHRGVRVSWFNTFSKSAYTRGINFYLTIDDVANQLEYQNHLCYYTGLDISTINGIRVMSIDRTDSNLCYTKENIKMVHKDVNFMKGSMSHDDFLEKCFLIHQKHKK